MDGCNVVFEAFWYHTGRGWKSSILGRNLFGMVQEDSVDGSVELGHVLVVGPAAQQLGHGEVAAMDERFCSRAQRQEVLYG